MNKAIKCLMLSMCCVAVLFLVGCEQERMIETTQQVEIDIRIVELVDQIVQEQELHEEIEKELQFLVNTKGYEPINYETVDREDENDISSLENMIGIMYDDVTGEYGYVIHGDIAVDRVDVQLLMQEKYQALPRTHKGHNYFVDPGTYTVYIHSGVPTTWSNAVQDALDEWNDLNLDVSFAGASTGSTYNYGAITVYMVSNISDGWADARHPTSDGNPGYRIRIDANDPYLSSSKKKLVMAHELGHTIGFYHTDGALGAYLTSSNYGCISSSCDGMDGNSIMNTWNPVPSWAGFSTCDEDVFTCIYGKIV